MGSTNSSHALNSPSSVAADPFKETPTRNKLNAATNSEQKSSDLDRKTSGKFRFPFFGVVETKAVDPVELTVGETTAIIEDEPLTPVTKSDTLHDASRRIWVFGARQDTVRFEQRFYLPTRFLAVLRKGQDVAVIPGNHAPTMEYVNFVKRVVGFNDDQIIFTSGNCASLDDDIINEQDVMCKLEDLVLNNPDDRFVIIPYTATEVFYQWAAKFQAVGVQTFGETTEWLEKYGDKGILHRHMSDLSKPSVIEQIDPNIPLAPGYLCSTTEHLIDAYRLLNCVDVAIKPLSGCAGEGIMFVSSEEELRNYVFAMGDVALEQKMELDLADDGLIIAPAVHYMRQELVGGGLVDQILEGTSYMGWRASVVSDEFEQEVNRITRAVIDFTAPQGPGGYDYLSVKGRPVLNDINTGRFNGAHQPKLFLEMYAPDAEWYCWRFKPSDTQTVEDFWAALVASNIAFTPAQSQSGVFPLTYSRGISGTFIAIAGDRQTCLDIYRQAAAILEAALSATC